MSNPTLQHQQPERSESDADSLSPASPQHVEGFGLIRADSLALNAAINASSHTQRSRFGEQLSVNGLRHSQGRLSETLRESQDGAEINTSCMHILVKSKIGWPSWLESEASLYDLFERTFAAVHSVLKLTEVADEFGIEVEIPMSQVERFEKEFRGRALQSEIDKIHGIHPLFKQPDAKLVKLTKTLGSGNGLEFGMDSVNNLSARIDALSVVGIRRKAEVEAMRAQQITLMEEIEKRAAAIESRIENKVIKEIGRMRLDMVMRQVVSHIVREMGSEEEVMLYEEPSGIQLKVDEASWLVGGPKGKEKLSRGGSKSVLL
ncbi:hypothetical protein BJ742DRAFT_809756 [Cladochytrium replicatum]|nr:hypothetical protein BJ742DRAFT_809756 [Cladochytrium replicatum]